MGKYKVIRLHRLALLLPVLLLFVWIAVIYGFSLHSGRASHMQSREVQVTIARLLHLENLSVNKKAFDFYKPFLTHPGPVTDEDIVRKTAHLTEYFILGILSFCTYAAYKNRMRRLHLLFVLVGPAVAFVDEKVIQRFLVTDRTSSVKDILLDSIGFCLALSFAFIIYGIVSAGRRHRQSRPRGGAQAGKSLTQL